jgi:hypothetical protein
MAIFLAVLFDQPFLINVVEVYTPNREPPDKIEAPYGHI